MDIEEAVRWSYLIRSSLGGSYIQNAKNHVLHIELYIMKMGRVHVPLKENQNVIVYSNYPFHCMMIFVFTLC